MKIGIESEKFPFPKESFVKAEDQKILSELMTLVMCKYAKYHKAEQYSDIDNDYIFSHFISEQLFYGNERINQKAEEFVNYMKQKYKIRFAAH